MTILPTFYIKEFDLFNWTPAGPREDKRIAIAGLPDEPRPTAPRVLSDAQKVAAAL
ncbi:hypothetical protein SJ05684_c08420 [Sinorhizobium sojae CCBAU 05684]|uniref:Uncharacterized protein n=1 Tax=Sinorhizobium sojae CCBAU 05684 TaxID=716928 RepID=A0A249P955_9HYPH|nr:hypothetical protein SJ05684_c08420 [Sinorhizobium sojae CCBAU 05684]